MSEAVSGGRKEEGDETALHRLPPSAHRLPLKHELSRKAFHIASAIIPIAYALGLARSLVLWALAILIAIALLVEMTRVRSARVKTVFTRAVGHMLREHEHAGLSGATWMVLSYAIAVLMFTRPVAVAAMWAVALGDASAAIVGKRLGRHRPRWMRDKSLEGSAACAVAAAAGALGVAGLGAAASVIAGLAAAAAEAPGRPFDDNIRIVMAVGLCVTLWLRFALWCCGA